jgi:PKD repeat protein
LEFNNEATSSLSTPAHQFSTPGSKLVSLSITDVNGCHNSTTTNLNIFNPPVADFNLPTINGTVCTEQPYAFTNTTSFDNGSTPSWQWFIDGQQISNTISLSHAFPQLGTHPVTLEASIPGCESSISKDFEITGLGASVDFDFFGQCLGTTTEFMDNTQGTITNYTWTFGDGATSSLASPTHSYADIGSYSVSLQATNASGCTNSQTQTVQITSAPMPDFYIDLPPFSCTGTPTQFYDATPPPPDGNIVSWNWSFNDAGATSTQQNPQHTYAQAGTYQVALQVETNFGCQSTVQIPIEISESLDADFVVGPACLQKGTQFQSLVLDDVLSWRWSIGNSSYSFPDPTHTFSLPGDYLATLVVVGANGCEALATKNITIHPAPLLDFSTSVACTNTETIFTDMTTGVDLPARWSWGVNSDVVATGSPAAITFASSGISPIQLSVTTTAGCSYSLTKNVVVAPSPTAFFTASTTFGPPPLQVQFNNTSVNASSYSWNFGIGNNTSNNANPLFTYTELGEYLTELTASNGAGCSDTFSQTINVLVPVYSLTLENLMISESLSSSAKTPVITIKNNSNVFVGGTDVWVTGSNGLRLKAYVDLNLLPNASTDVEVPIQIFSNEDFLCVELDLLGDANLSDNSSCQNLTDKPVLMTPYPNPTSGTLWFDVVLREPGVGTLRIADSMGKTVFSQQFSDLNAGMNRIQIDFGNQPPGAYLAIWEVNGKTSTFRFLAQ